MTRPLALALALALVCLAPPAAAQSEADLAAAKQLGQEGLALFDKGEYEAALAKLDQADQRAKIPPLGLFGARSLARLGRLREAEARYAAVLAIPLAPNSPQVWQQAKVDAKDELEKLRPTIPTIEIAIVGAAVDAAKITLDGKPLSLEADAKVPVDPGEHTVTATANGVTKSATQKVAANDHVRAELDLTPPKTQPGPPPDAGPSPLLIAGATIAGAGGLGLLAWGATGVAAMVTADGYGCDGAACPVDDVSDLTALRLTSTISFYAGAGLALAGGGLLIAAAVTGGGDEAKTGVVPVIGPGYAGVRGRF